MRLLPKTQVFKASNGQLLTGPKSDMLP